MKYTGDYLFFLEIGLSIPAAITNQYFSLIAFVRNVLIILFMKFDKGFPQLCLHVNLRYSEWLKQLFLC